MDLTPVRLASIACAPYPPTVDTELKTSRRWSLLNAATSSGWEPRNIRGYLQNCMKLLVVPKKNDDEAWDLGDFQFSDTQVGKVTYLNEQVSKSLKASVTDYTGGWQVGSTQHKKILHLQRDSSTQNLLLRCPSLGHFMTTVLYLSNGISWHFRMGGWYSLMGCSCFFSIFSWVFPIFFMGFCLRSNSKSCLTTACGIALRAPPQEGADERSTCNLWLVNFGMQKAIDRIRLDSLYIWYP